MRVNQQITLSQQLLKALEGGDGNTVNVITIENINMGPGESPGLPDPHEAVGELLDALPHPRLENLRRLAFAIAMEGRTQAEAAEYLGVSVGTIKNNQDTNLIDIQGDRNEING